MLRVIRRLLPFVVIVCVLLPAQAAFAFKDVPSGYWDYAAIQYVASQHDWMADFDNGTFHPRVAQHREWLARALVRAYAPSQPVDPNIQFPDLPKNDPYFPFANVAVHNGWLGVGSGGAFLPDAPLHTSTFDRALILAMGLRVGGQRPREHPRGDRRLHVHGGARRSPTWSSRTCSGLHYNHPSGSEYMDLEPYGWITRDEVAYSLWKAATLPSWQRAEAEPLRRHRHAEPRQPRRPDAGDPAADHGVLLRVGRLSLHLRRRVGQGQSSRILLRRTGKGRFRLLGLRVVAAEEGRRERLRQRVDPRVRGLVAAAADELRHGARDADQDRVRQPSARGDLLFFADNGGTGWADADHVGVYLGNGWMVHSTGSNAGVAIEWIGDGWWRDHFLWGRRLF